ncbi:MAG: CCA tRNA nucleotidyltransferase [Thaumarchaeota archaeon]|jgi:tRNA nucleotidyltransferase (CCA-adding enzyme)|nr:CCA tRNA nucleotidyltransferase [Candidatus Geocrenenecus arthurdayi]MCL7389036.1 CCA tRNA nucleotidyltransferase [Candidatus Geocrenenecus arthurdayi]MCL7391296.1 CCA tRNA nucleotidyltransferase [Candidatus Geocrenenecus arthurdayi]MCL7396282.1 CCA tRNA nucleotidyltransferase [Candidatus Geocrenenecus arthurdayi]
MIINDVLNEALQLYKPSQEEEKHLMDLANKIIHRAEKYSPNYKSILKITLEGSLAKKTWIRGREEVDIFVHFDSMIPREEMEEQIVELGFKILKDLDGKPRLMYADHPYVEGRINNVVVNIVACYYVTPPNWLSATDRTPYHTRYIIEKMKPEIGDHIRLMKAFMVGCGVYGAEIKVRGFSGYLTELLMLNYGDFIKTIEAISKWKPPIIIDIEKYYDSIDEVLKLFLNQPLIVIDPVDKYRNVASAVSEQKLSELILASRLFLESPSIKFFKPKPPIIRLSSIRRKVRKRKLIGVVFKLSRWKPPDVLWGELRKSEEAVKRTLERLGFRVYRSDSWTDEEKTCIILCEINNDKLPYTRLHQGPPVYHPNSLEFIKKWKDNPEREAGPWIEDSRLYVLRVESVVDVKKLLKKEIEEGRVALAKGLIEDIKKGKITTSIENLMRNRKLRSFIYEFVEASLPFI